MKFQPRWTVAALLIIASSFSMGSNAALIDRGGGLIYDTDLNITWLADANYAKTSGFDADGSMAGLSAGSWVSNLSYGGYTDWRLPATVQPDATCGTQGFNISYGHNCTGSEMGHLFYTELGGVAGASIFDSSDPDLALFTNIQSIGYYWSGTVAVNYDWLVFRFSDGNQFTSDIYGGAYVWAVRDGDVASVVPVPAAVWLFGSGLLGLIGVAHRKAS